MLIADDNADMREYLTNLLRNSGYSVSEVGRRPAGVGGHPRRRPRPGHQRRHDARPRRTATARSAARPIRAPPPFRSCCCPLGPGRRPRSKVCRPAPTTTSSNRSPPRSCSPGCAPTSSWHGCATITPAGAPRWSTRCRRRSSSATSTAPSSRSTPRSPRSSATAPNSCRTGAVHPWWPDAETDPEAHRQVEAAFAGLRSNNARRLHRSGHSPGRAPAVGCGQLQSRRRPRHGPPGHGRHLPRRHGRALPRAAPDRVGCTESATGAGRYGRRRAAAERPRSCAGCGRRGASPVVTFAGDRESGRATNVVCAGEPVEWADLTPRQRQVIESLRDGDLLTTVTQEPGAAGIALQHLRGASGRLGRVDRTAAVHR